MEFGVLASSADPHQPTVVTTMQDTRNQRIGSYCGVVAAALVAAVACSMPMLAQQQTDGATVVTIDVIVRDSGGVFVSGLGIEDFRVLADQVERDIAFLVLRRDAEAGDHYTLGFYTDNPDSTLPERRLRVEVAGPEDEDSNVRFRPSVLNP